MDSSKNFFVTQQHPWLASRSESAIMVSFQCLFLLSDREMPVISFSPTKLAAVYTLLCKSIASACSLSQEQVLVVLDQANYSKREYGVMVMSSVT